MTWKQVAPELWVAEGELNGPMGVWFPVRTVIVRMGDALWVHSPIDLAPFAERIDALGEVRWIVNPNGFHGKWVADACARWPDAELLCASAHERLGTELPPWAPLDPTPPSAWSPTLDARLIEGCPKVTETVFLHRTSRTLIVTDLLFHVHEAKTWTMRAVFGLTGVWQRPMQSRLWRMMVRDREAAARSVADVLNWDFERVVMAHGRLIEDDARGAVERALAWMRRAPAD